MRRLVRRHGAGLAFLLLTAIGLEGCVTSASPVSPRLLTASPDSRIGGEARFEGEFKIRGNCVVVGSTWKGLPIFDPSVRLTETGDTILDSRTGVRVAVGERFSASAAFLRDEGRGWSLSDIEQATGVAIPKGCGTNMIVRLRDIQNSPSL